MTGPWFTVPKGTPVHWMKTGEWKPSGREQIIDLSAPDVSVWTHGEWTQVTWPGGGGYWRRVVKRNDEFVAQWPS